MVTNSCGDTGITLLDTKIQNRSARFQKKYSATPILIIIILIITIIIMIFIIIFIICTKAPADAKATITDGMDTIESKDKIDMQKRHGRDSTALSSCGRVISDTKMNKKMSIISAPSRYSDHIEYVCVSSFIHVYLK